MEQKIDTPSGRFHIRPYTNDDEERTRLLWRVAFGKEVTRDIWKWKYHQPRFGRRILLCVTSENQPVVMFSCMPYPALLHGNAVRIGHAVDSMSHPEFRGSVSGRRGLFALTAGLFFDLYGRKDDLIFIYGFPGERHYRLGKILLNYTRMTNRLLYFTWQTGILKNRVKLFKGRLGSVRGDDPSLDDLAWRMKDYYPFAVLRDSSFMNWRYEQHPTASYHIFTSNSLLRRKIKGFMVVRLEAGLATIVDMLLPPDQEVITDFLARACARLKDMGVEKVRTWLPDGHFQTGALRSMGIEPEDEPLGIIPAAVARDFHPGCPHQQCIREMFYTMADGDLV